MDLRLEGERPLDRRVFALALPAIGENLLHTTLLLVDTLMVAPFGSIPLAASAIAGVITWRAHMTFGCIEKGTTALVARYTGSGDHEKVGAAVAQSIILAAVMGGLMTVFGWYLASNLLIWMKAEPDVVASGTPFLQIIMLASLPRLFLSVASASLRGSGDTRSPMYVTLGMNVTNILFNYPLIYGIPALAVLQFGGWPGLQLTGSAISTALSLFLAAAALGWIMYHGRSRFQVGLRHFRPNFPIMKSIIRISWPSLVEELLITIGFLAFFRFITEMGTATIAAHTIATRVESLSFMAGFGFAIAASTLVGQSLGQKNILQAHQSFRLTTKYCVLLMTCISVFLILGGGVVVQLFAREESVEWTARTLLLIAAVEQPLLGIVMTLGGGLRGAGDTFNPMLTSLVGNVIIRVGVCYFLAFTLGWGIMGIYLGTLVDWMVRSAMLFHFYHKGNWSQVKV